ncbi:hypothetical protein [Massilia endophytica]|uniref:hypothetical protein n=1 Tax=Massilia endophytica TaxID=2899220 RepID=UPI001E5B78FF|nr:hypothetical protein [Massilia endophytica]UGQ46287.1 hypothetical protein LSQ66_21370 [Massilia endophytica]
MPHSHLRSLRRAGLAGASALALGALVIACGGGGGGGGTVAPPPPPPDPGPTGPGPIVNGPAWTSFGRDAQHSAVSAIATQTLSRIVWQAPVDMAPQYSAQGYLLVHYGSPVITGKNTVILPVKRAATAQYKVEARSGANGFVMWSMDSDYVMPAHNWMPSYNVTLTAANRIVAPGAGGKILFRDDADSPTSTNQTSLFYSAATYAANKAALDAQIYINTPITADSAGNLYFGFEAAAGNAANLSSGIARLAADGNGNWKGISQLTGEAALQKVAMNSAPALSADQKTLYIVAKGSASSTAGSLLALDSTTLELKSKRALIDPETGLAARITDDSTASPAVGHDGDVYIGVLETTTGQHNQRGWLLHFDAPLATVKTPGSFGWDDTASFVAANLVPSYKGNSPYLVMTKYNNYGRSGSGDSKNRIAILDPSDPQTDAISGKPVMREVLTILGPTPDPRFPGGVVEWCINTAAVDPFTKSVLVNSEDGYLYRWDLATNTLSERIRLTSGLGESYTPTAIGADGKVYAINNAIAFAIGK